MKNSSNNVEEVFSSTWWANFCFHISTTQYFSCNSLFRETIIISSSCRTIMWGVLAPSSLRVSDVLVKSTNNSFASRFVARTSFDDLTDSQDLWFCESISPKTLFFLRIFSISGLLWLKSKVCQTFAAIELRVMAL